MPYIRRIEVSGFKTFGSKTTLLLDKGFIAITGPNGSGKTNIIDAVLFGLGELSARRLRASNFSSLIFHGGSSPEVKRKSKAKVTIQFNNEDGRLPTDTSTVTLSREIDQNGESVFRINGRKVLRAYVMEVLSIAGISPYGQNVILQGALTRLAEFSPHERRKIIEDMIGIAQYDSEKTEAEEKLGSANISIKTALGQVSEVQRRIESLERERNDLLRHNFVEAEVKRLEAVKLSGGIGDDEGKIRQLSTEKAKLDQRLERLREQREKLRTKRHEVETEWRRLGFEGVEDGQTRIFRIQMEIGELRSRMSEITTKVEASKSSLSGLTTVRENNSEHIESLKKDIEESQFRIKQLTADLDALSKEIAGKQAEYDTVCSEAAQARSSLEERSEAIRESEAQLDKLYKEAISVQGDHARNQSRVNVHSERLKDLEEKRSDLKSSLERLEQSLKGLEDVQKQQKEQLVALQRASEVRAGRKRVLETEVKEAGKIAEIAREAVVEFEARKGLVDKFKAEEAALKHIEELSELGIIKGIHGRLKDLVSVRREYERAVEAASAGWFSSLVVDSLDVAFACAETLRQLKLGRVKIIPLQGLSPNSHANLPNIAGMGDRLSTFVKHDERYASVVSYVLGDTLLAFDEKAAVTASQMGCRSVTSNGDVYEAGGGIESGFYRAPVDFSSFVPSESALKTLGKAVEALKENLNRREADVGELDKEVAETQSEVSRLAETLGKLEGETERVQKSIQQTRLNINRSETNIANLRAQLEEEKAQVELLEVKRDEIALEEAKIQQTLSELKEKIDLSSVQGREQRREALGNVIISLRQKAGNIEAELTTLQSKLENVLRPGLENVAVQRDKAAKQISILEKEIAESAQETEGIKTRIGDLEKTKLGLSSALLNAKEEARGFTAQVDKMDEQLQVLEEEYAQADKLLDELRLNLQTFQLQMNRRVDQLKALGFEKPFEVSPKEAQEAEASMRLMRFELERIGAVNQLAPDHYAEQVSRYKELSIRMNELEREKMAIEDFIKEIEQRKHNTFMEAFNQTNERIDKYFFKLTDGGTAALRLENPENAFEGGVDMVVQFPDKPAILVSGASSGERSVAAVAFLFALQQFTPASFYLLDEIDAHLDAFHVERLGELLAEEADKSQFVVVTLKPEMVSKADRIYGVYGREGVSYVVSTTFKGAAQ